MTVANTSFEGAGAQPGLAASWTPIVTATAGTYAQFDGAPGEPPTATESFEAGWGNDDYETRITSGTDATFDPDLIPPPTTESFERWVLSYQTRINGGAAAQFDGALVIEGFELGWGGDSYEARVTPGTTFADTLETGWLDGYATRITGGTAATFATPSGPSSVEDFEAVQADRPFVVDVDANELVSPAHDLDPDQKVTVGTTGLRPANLVEDFVYYAIVVDANRVQLSKTPGGSAVVVGDAGVGKHRLIADPAIYWPSAEL